MARMVGTIDEAELQAVLQRLWKAGDPAGVTAVVEEVPLLRHPTVHAIVRQQFLRMGPAAAEQSGFKYLYEDFAYTLQARAFREVYQRAQTSQPNGKENSEPQELPAFFRDLLTAMGDRQPAPNAPPLALGSQQCVNELHEVLGKRALPNPYTQTPGVVRSVLSVLCAGCGGKRLVVRPYGVDLVTNPSLREAALRGRLFPPACPQCGQHIGHPLRVWLHDGPQPRDPVEALSCAVRVEPDLFIYIAPEGMLRDPPLDRVHEIRFDLLVRRLPWPPYSGATRMAVVYSSAELRERIGTESELDPIGRFAGELRRKLDEETLTLSQALDGIRLYAQRCGASWKISLPRGPAIDPITTVLLSAAAVEAAEIQDKEVPLRVALEVGLAGAFLGISEPELARSRLQRAQQLIATLPPSEQREELELSMLEVRASCEGKPAPASVYEHLSKSLAGRDDIGSALLRAEAESAHALSERLLRGPEATDATFQATIASCSQLMARVESDPSLQAHLPRAQKILSGVLANWAAGWQDHPGMQHADAAALQRNLAPALELALDLAVAAQAWEFAGIQAHRLTNVYRASARREDARAMAARAAEYAARASDHERAWRTLAFLADDDLKHGDGASAQRRTQLAALEWVRKAIGLGQRARPAVDEVIALASHGFESTKLGGSVNAAIELAEALKAATTAAALGGRMSRQANSASSGVPERLRALQHERERLRLQRIWQPKAALDGALQDVEARLREELDAFTLSSPHFARWVDATDVQLPEIRSLQARLRDFGDGATLIGLLPANETLWVYAVSADDVTLHRSIWPSGFHGSVLEAEPLERFSTAILAPLAVRLSKLTSGARLWISAVEGLYDFPYAALSWNGRPLGAQFALSIVHSAEILQLVLDTKLDTHGILAIAPARPGMQELAGAREEARAMCRRFASAGLSERLLIGPGATVPALLAARDYGILHLACHARESPDDASRTELLLSPTPIAPDSGELGADRILGELQLPSGCFVNLAACASGRAGRSQGAFSEGLVPAFLMVGASTVLATLWPIDDRWAHAFQTALYEQILQGKSPAQALSHTRSACLRGELGAELSELRHWAAYAAYGAG